ncbi:unnamed protein product, partial [Ceratitis capitata]
GNRRIYFIAKDRHQEKSKRTENQLHTKHEYAREFYSSVFCAYPFRFYKALRSNGVGDKAMME